MHVHTIQMKMFALQPRRWKCSSFFADGGGSKKGQNIDIGHVVNNEKCWVAVCKASAATQKNWQHGRNCGGIDDRSFSDIRWACSWTAVKKGGRKKLKETTFPLISGVDWLRYRVGAHRGYLKKNRTKSQFYFNDEKFTPQIGLMMQEFVVWSRHKK